MVNIKVLWYYQLIISVHHGIATFYKDTEHYITLFTYHTKPTSFTDRKCDSFQSVNQFHMCLLGVE